MKQVKDVVPGSLLADRECYGLVYINHCFPSARKRQGSLPIGRLRDRNNLGIACHPTGISAHHVLESSSLGSRGANLPSRRGGVLPAGFEDHPGSSDPLWKFSTLLDSSTAC